MGSTGNTIRVMRESLGLSIRELARRAEVNAGYLSQVERGHREPEDRWLREVREALAAALVEKRGVA